MLPLTDEMVETQAVNAVYVDATSNYLQMWIL
jgi:hypothetical protein